MLEIRNDLISQEAGQTQWASRLAHVLEQAVTLVFPPAVRMQSGS
jgi:predicted N-formylglutamate amidohydrolase